MSKIKAVFFDQDGVIIDTERDGHRVAFNRTFKEFGYDFEWSVEEYHKSLKQNASAAKSPSRTIKTQSNHLFASMLAYVKMENDERFEALGDLPMDGKRMIFSGFQPIFDTDGKLA